ncbi:MAG: hypothetical protein ACK492_10775 [Chitinophagaceae bacterium]|jgi:hypothetical protein
MKRLKRDLILLRKDDQLDELNIEREVECLNYLLQTVETISSLCKAHELIDMNRFKIYQDTLSITKALKQKELNPFQFIFNKN